MIGQSKMNERLDDVTPNEILLDLSISLKKRKKKNRYNKNLLLIDWSSAKCI